MNTPSAHRSRQGFTLVELLVAITIIGILMSIAIPAVMRSITTAKQTRIKLEVNAIAQAVEQYQQKYGDYPPDGSSLEVLQRHMGRVFPRMAEPDKTLLTRLIDDEVDNTVGNFSPLAMDRAEALVFFLGGFSDDIQHPLTGSGGPLTLAPGFTDETSTNILEYQYNATRDNAFFEFDPRRLTVARATDIAPLLSTDEALFAQTAAPYELYGGPDPLPVYLAADSVTAPIVYFDSRTYGVIGQSSPTVNVYNGYSSRINGSVRPYKTELNPKPPRSGDYANEREAFEAFAFHNANTFQVISPGMDGIFGSIVSIDPTDAAAQPIHFLTESGRPVRPASGSGFNTPASLIFTAPSLGTLGFQDLEWLNGIVDINVNGHLDNSTNFGEAATLEGDLQ